MTNCFRNLLTFFCYVCVQSSLIRDGSNIKNQTFESLEPWVYWIFELFLTSFFDRMKFKMDSIINFIECRYLLRRYKQMDFLFSKRRQIPNFEPLNIFRSITKLYYEWYLIRPHIHMCVLLLRLLHCLKCTCIFHTRFWDSFLGGKSSFRC